MTANILLYLAGIGFQELLILIIPGILWIWAIIDLVKRDFNDGATKIVWALVIIFIPLVGSLLYLIAGRSRKP